MSETLGEKPVEEILDPLYTDSQLVQWAVDVLKGHGLTKRPDMIWWLERLSERLRSPKVAAASQQPAEPRFTLEEMYAAVTRWVRITNGYRRAIDPDKAWTHIKADLQEARRWYCPMCGKTHPHSTSDCEARLER